MSCRYLKREADKGKNGERGLNMDSVPAPQCIFYHNTRSDGTCLGCTVLATDGRIFERPSSSLGGPIYGELWGQSWTSTGGAAAEELFARAEWNLGSTQLPTVIIPIIGGHFSKALAQQAYEGAG
ncbi:hypothetical protein CC78DRAFT_617789 [Lojkania enalia]|uniref:Uncharacterized protein n=1 Tax=Lojkania enalia TaxID=147567 RepID=A0A9P4KC44_9PLEO|nr:hypothetical protein CC78DRAFT_617789 [Didymosphaeria enalia]